MLQVYRIFVLYYKPPEEDIDKLFPENDASNRLCNVQTAIKSVQHTRLAIRLVSRLQRQAKWHRGHFKRRSVHMPNNQGEDDNKERATWCIATLHSISGEIPANGGFVFILISIGWFSLAHKHKHNISEDSSNISINMSTKHKKNKHTCFSYVVLTRNHRDISISISTRKTNFCGTVARHFCKS